MLLKNIYNEFIKILAKPRSYIGIGALTLLICIILFAMKADGSSFISFVTSSFEQTLSFNGTILNGNLIAFIILQMLIVHIPLLVALVTGDLISGEAAMGTVRMLATKPISRTKIVISKFIAGAVYTFILTLWLIFLSLFVSKFIFGSGDLIVLNSDGSARRAFCYLTDATIGFLTILLNGENGQAYNLGNPKEEYSILELAKILVNAYPEFKLEVILNTTTNTDYLKSTITRNSPNIDKLKKFIKPFKHLPMILETFPPYEEQIETIESE
jgi:hypothetical protein